jgi:hypothetical protein
MAISRPQPCVEPVTMITFPASRVDEPDVAGTAVGDTLLAAADMLI